MLLKSQTRMQREHVLDVHQPDAAQEPEQREKLPELAGSEQRHATDINLFRSLFIFSLEQPFSLRHILDFGNHQQKEADPVNE